ncbi:MAG TPA: hypothetical protein VHM26_15895, partial [Chitinophagaceae bacterium]|nr:hypothetical protein [Chitinophagaceae bacterium]
MFYFKNEAVPISEIDLIQIAKVQEFKKKLHNMGGLYRDFTDITNFEQLVRINLNRLLPEMLQLTSLDTAVDKENVVETAISEEEDEEIGILDKYEIIENSFENLVNCLSIITSEMNDMAKKTNDTKSKLNRLSGACKSTELRESKR